MVPRIAQEFADVSLGDKRLDRRVQKLAERASTGPSLSFPKMVGDASELESLYRFFQNDRVTADALLRPHRTATVQRCNEYPVVVVAHDTTGLSYRGKRQGTGPMMGEYGNGFYLHASLAISADGDQLPLGITALQTMVRPQVPYFKQELKQQRTAPFESQKWREGVDETASLPFESAVVHVMDREAGSYDVLADMVMTAERFVIRGQRTRLASKSTKPTLPTSSTLELGELLNERETTLTRTVRLSPRPRNRPHAARVEREAELHIRASSVVLMRPTKHYEPAHIRLNVVQVIERNTPEGEEPIEWTLFTTEPIDSNENIARVIDYYRARWRIEEYFKALKSGCAIEERQLTTFEALQKALAFFAPIAWRLLAMRTVARMKPPVAASSLFTSEDVAVIRQLASRRKHVLGPEPSMQHVLLALAAIGGHLRRNGHPGWMTLGRGYDHFCIAREAFDILKQM
jgi:hypothetical protein